MPHPLSHKYPIPISLLSLTSHFMCVQICHMVNVDVPASVGAPPLDTKLGSYEDATKSSKKCLLLSKCAELERLIRT